MERISRLGIGHLALVVAVAATAAASIAGSASASSHSPTIVEFNRFAVRPSEISQGASNRFFRLHWSSWGSSTARARGRGSAGCCYHIHTYPLTLGAYDVQSYRGRQVYGRLRLRNRATHHVWVEKLNRQAGQYD